MLVCQFVDEAKSGREQQWETRTYMRARGANARVGGQARWVGWMDAEELRKILVADEPTTKG